MCEQCQAHDDYDDLDALAAAFAARQVKPVAARPDPAKPQGHALFDRRVAAPRGKQG